MKVNNNKGFSLIEVLVTVGLVGILVGIAIPSYNGYKQNTVRMALKADLGNGAKVYNAKYAVDSSYCYNLEAVGLTKDRAGNPIYKKKAFYGFDTPDTDCSALTAGDLFFKSVGGYCDKSGKDVYKAMGTACSAAGGTWKSSPDLAFSGTVGNCKLDSNRFRMGATTNVSGLKEFLTADQEGRIYETTADCDDTGY